METERKREIYTLSDPCDGSVRYVGVTHHRRTRFTNHLGDARAGVGNAKCNWIRTLLAVNLTPTMTVIDSGVGPSWQAAERKWIAHYREQVGLLLTNRTEGGGGMPLGFKMPPKSAETRRIISRPLTLAKMAAAHRRK